jgi:cobalt-precorrin 5A hydrolase
MSGLPLAGYGADAMARYDALLSHRSALSWRHTGCHGVAEGAALAHCATLSGAEPRLLVTRISSPGATVALAAAAT